METSTVEIVRVARWLWGVRAFKVVLDGATIGSIRNGRSEQFEVASGDHVLQIRIDISRSPALPVTIDPGATARFLCDPGDISTWLARTLRRQPRIPLIEDRSARPAS
jgi:hypothetical protein